MKKRIYKKLFTKLNKASLDIILKIFIKWDINLIYFRKSKHRRVKEISSFLNKKI